MLSKITDWNTLPVLSRRNARKITLVKYNVFIFETAETRSTQEVMNQWQPAIHMRLAVDRIKVLTVDSQPARSVRVYVYQDILLISVLVANPASKRQLYLV